jgi:hypothetical protein
MTETFPLKQIEFDKDSIQNDLLKYGGDEIGRDEDTGKYLDEVDGRADRKKWEDQDRVFISSTHSSNAHLRDSVEVKEITYMPGLGVVRVNWETEDQVTTIFIPEDRVYYMTYFEEK